MAPLSFLVHFNGLQIFKGDAQIPKCLSPGAKNIIKRILDPKPETRLTMAEIKADDWFKQEYTPACPEEEEDIHVPLEETKNPGSPTLINAFQLIGMSSCLDLSGFFEKEVTI